MSPHKLKENDDEETGSTDAKRAAANDREENGKTENGTKAPKPAEQFKLGSIATVKRGSS